MKDKKNCNFVNEFYHEAELNLDGDLNLEPVNHITSTFLSIIYNAVYK